jgi:hypothetical protein
MNRGALRLLGLAAILLSITIAYELFAGNPDETDMIVANAPKPADVRSAGPAATAPTEQTAQWVAIALARPLFAATRRPDAVAPVAAAAAPDDGPSELPRLTGILMLPHSNRAVFQPAGDKKPIVVLEGGAIAGWTVQKILATEVTLTGPGGTTTLETKFDENMVPPAPQLPAAMAGGGRNGIVPPGGGGTPAGIRPGGIPPGTPIIPKLGVPAGRTPPRNGAAGQLNQQTPIVQPNLQPPLVTPAGPIQRGHPAQGGVQ